LDSLFSSVLFVVVCLVAQVFMLLQQRIYLSIVTHTTTTQPSVSIWHQKKKVRLNSSQNHHHEKQLVWAMETMTEISKSKTKLSVYYFKKEREKREKMGSASSWPCERH